MFNTSLNQISVGKPFFVEGGTGKEKCIMGLHFRQKEKKQVNTQKGKDTQTHTNLKCHEQELHVLTQTHKHTRTLTHTAILLGLNVFVTVKSDKVTCMPGVTGSFSCVFMSVCFNACLPCFSNPVCSELTELWHICFIHWLTSDC